MEEFLSSPPPYSIDPTRLGEESLTSYTLYSIILLKSSQREKS